MQFFAQLKVFNYLIVKDVFATREQNMAHNTGEWCITANVTLFNISGFNDCNINVNISMK
jgi:hypothetical protein